MATVIMPKMGDAMEEGTLLKWLKSVGEEVAEGDPIAEIETDKVTLELEAGEAGYLTSTLVEEGAVVPIGAPVATIGAESEIGQTAPAAAAPVAEAAAPAPAPEPVAVAASAAPAPAEAPVVVAATQVSSRTPGERLRASPLVKRLAEEHGIDLNQVAGTGPGGRIVKNDISPFLTGAQPAPKAGPAAAPAPVVIPAVNGATTPVAAAPAPTTSGATPKGRKIELARIRRTTGKRMSESKAGIPHYYVTINVDMTDAIAFRKQINAAVGEGGVRVSVNDLIVKAAALALRENPNVNTSFENGDLYQHDSIDINIAISLDGGLIAPFVPAADQKSLGTIARMTKDLGNRARNGGLTPEEYQGGTFTISNLGMFDVDEFIAVINPPQAAILAVGSAQEVPVVRNGEIAIGSVMKLTLSSDHRALDGAEAARFLGSVKKFLQNPMLLAIS